MIHYDTLHFINLWIFVLFGGHNVMKLSDPILDLRKIGAATKKEVFCHYG